MGCWGAALGLALALLVVMRGNYVFAIPLAVLAGLASKRPAVAMGSCLAGALAIVLCLGAYWGVARLNQSMGVKVRQDSLLTHVLIQGAFQYRTEPLDWRPWEQEARAGSRDYAAYAEARTEIEKRTQATGQPMPAVEWAWLKNSMIGDPWAWLRMAPWKALSALWFRISPVRVERVFGVGLEAQAAAVVISVLLNAPFLFTLSLAIWGTFKGRTKGSVAQWFCWVPFFAGILFIAGTYSEPRYLVPGFPGVLVLAALVLERRVASALQPGNSVTAMGESSQAGSCH